jgi:hypothetical protein
MHALVLVLYTQPYDPFYKLHIILLQKHGRIATLIAMIEPCFAKMIS